MYGIKRTALAIAAGAALVLCPMTPSSAAPVTQAAGATKTAITQTDSNLIEVRRGWRGGGFRRGWGGRRFGGWGGRRFGGWGGRRHYGWGGRRYYGHRRHRGFRWWYGAPFFAAPFFYYPYSYGYYGNSCYRVCRAYHGPRYCRYHWRRYC